MCRGLYNELYVAILLLLGCYNVDRQFEYDKEGSALRIRGKNVLENEHVKVCDCPTTPSACPLL